MLDTMQIQERLEDARLMLTKIETERAALLTLIDGYERLLRIRSNGVEPSRQLLLTPEPAPSTVPKRGMSARRAILTVLEQANGTPLHCRELWERASVLGAHTTANDAISTADLLCYSLKSDGKPLEKVAPRTWRWVSDVSNLRKAL